MRLPRSHLPPTLAVAGPEAQGPTDGPDASSPPPLELERQPYLAPLRARPPELSPGVREQAAVQFSEALGKLSEALDQGRISPSPRLEARLKALQTALDSAGGKLDGDGVPGLRGTLHRLAQLGSPRARELGSKLLDSDLGRVCGWVAGPEGAGARRVLAHHPDAAGVLKTLAATFPGAEALGTTQLGLRTELDADLAVGGLGQELESHMARAGLEPRRIEAFFDVMAEVRAGFRAGAEGFGRELDADRDMQRSNWIHTRVEVAKAARAFAASPAAESPDAKDALFATLLGSLCSDAFKDASVHSLLWHNRAGAELVLPLLAARHLEPADAPMLETAKKLAHEHQITPALFMAGALGSHLKGQPEDVVEEITTKVGAPLDAPRRGTEIEFSDEARAALEQAGLPGWATMDPTSAHFELSQVVALADVMQYAAADGILKIAVDIRDPEQKAPFMRDPTLHEAIGSSLGFSFEKGLEAIVRPELVEHAREAASGMASFLETSVHPEVERRLSKIYGPVGVHSLPYWRSPVSTENALAPEVRAIVDTVKSTFRDVLAEKAGVPLDPFGGRGPS